MSLRDLERLCRDTLIVGIPPGLDASIRELVAQGSSAKQIVRHCCRATGRTRRNSLAVLAVEALAERLVAEREAERN